MSAFRRDCRRLHAGRSAADDHDLLAARGGGQSPETQLPPAGWILDAGDGISLVEVPDAGLIAGDAGADIVGCAAGRLVRHLWIADEGASHAADIGVIARDHRLSLLRLIDAPGHEYRYLRLPLEAGGVGDDIAGFHGHGRCGGNGGPTTKPSDTLARISDIASRRKRRRPSRSPP